jgi:serine/threonine protein phosphatase 1
MWRIRPPGPIFLAMNTRRPGRGSANRSAVVPQAPAGSRIYAIGDVHGRADLLRRLQGLIHEDAYRRQAPRNVVVYLGDYVDRGDESPAVIDLLLDEPLPSFESFYLKGNHEESVLRFLEDTSVGPAWLFYGGAQTLRSYGVRPPEVPINPRELARAQRDLAEKLPPRHRRFMQDLALTHIEGDYFFAHAGIRPGTPLDRQTEQDLLWIRDDFLLSDENFGKIVVHGHTITERPEVRRNRIGIDTGAFSSGRLTCLVLEGSQLGFLQT